MTVIESLAYLQKSLESSDSTFMYRDSLSMSAVMVLWPEDAAGRTEAFDVAWSALGVMLGKRIEKDWPRVIREFSFSQPHPTKRGTALTLLVMYQPEGSCLST